MIAVDDTGPSSERMLAEATAVVLVGFQNEFFGPDGGLRPLMEDGSAADRVLARTVELLRRLADTATTLVATPLTFTSDYRELRQPVGVLAAIRDRGLLQSGSVGAATVSAVEAMGSRVREIAGKRGLNAFVDTDLDDHLRSRQIRDVVVCGALTSVCVDSTARSAVDLGYRVTIVQDCIVGRTAFEQRFYCDEIFPLYARVLGSDDVVEELG